MRRLFLTGCMAMVLALDACGGDPASTATQARGASTTSTAAPTTAAPAHAPETNAAEPDADSVEGTVVRFSSRDAEVDVTIRSNNPTTRDFLSQLPMTLSVEEFAGREKISYLPRRLETEGSPGSDPEDGDLIYFVPWGNLGVYYNAEGVGPSDDTIGLGTYEASLEQPTRLEGADVTIEVVEP